MPRANRPRGGRGRPRREDDPRPLTAAGLVRSESGPDGDWQVRHVPAVAGSSRSYRCPGCEQLVLAGAAHVVAWPAPDWGSVDDRRHWHTACWIHRRHRRPGGRRR